MKKTYAINMCEGAILPKLFLFAVPLILSSILQLLFNAADVIVVGRFSGSTSLAAVGSTTSLTMLLVNLFVGISIGTNVLAARYYGAKDEEAVQETVHTAIVVALVSGVLMVIVGLITARPLLTLMGTPDDVIEKSVLYMSVYFCGMPGFMVYNFGAAILRAIGDTRRPLYFLIVTGVINVVLNLCFVIGLHMDVAGVALATISAQYLSAILVVRCLIRTDDICRLHLKKLRIHKNRFAQMMRIGLAAGFESVVFNISNVLIQSSVNSFGSVVMAGNTAASNIEGFVFVAMNSVAQTTLSFTSQNYGAQKFKRIDQIFVRCLGMVAVVGLTLGLGAYFLGNQLLSFYTTDPAVIRYGLFRLSIISTTYCICGLMNVAAGAIRGLGYSLAPTIVSLLGACALRIVWLFTVFRACPTLFCLYISYPITWVITLAAHLCCLFVIRRRLFPRT